MKEMKTSIRTAAQSVLVNLVLNFVFVLGTRFHWNSGHFDYDPNSGMKESGIALASTLSNAWQTFALMNVLRSRLEDAQKISMKFLTNVGGAAVVSVPLACYAYNYFNSKPDTESFYGFFAAIGISIIPFYGIGRQYFIDELKKIPPDKL